MALRALIVEDRPADVELVIGELARGRELIAEAVATPAAARAALLRAPWDLIFTEWAIPGFGAPAVLELLRELELDIPVLIVSGAIGEEVAVTAMRSGAREIGRASCRERV